MPSEGETGCAPNTLVEAVDKILLGASPDATLAQFVDAFDLAPTVEARYRMIVEEPALTSDKRFDALIGAIAEYLAKQHRLGRVPPWAMRECLTFSSPAEFASRNIFTEERPLRRARGPHPAKT